MLEHYLPTLPRARVPIMHPVIFYDDCEGSLLWYLSGTGADFAGIYDTTLPLVGTKSLKLSTKTTTPASNDSVQAKKTLWLPASKQARLQLCWRPYSASTAHVLRVILFWYNGTQLATAELLFNTSDGSIKYYNAAAGYTTLTGWTFVADRYGWTFIDIAIDLHKITYSRIAISNQVTDLSDQALFTAASAVTPNLSVILHLETYANAQVHGFIDQVLLTGETP